MKERIVEKVFLPLNLERHFTGSNSFLKINQVKFNVIEIFNTAGI